LAAATVDEVARLIRLTSTHTTDAGDGLGALVLDADLSVLGTAPGRYHVYARDVRLEYPQFSDAEFAFGRLRVLERLLNLDTLYRTPAAQQRWLTSAHANLTSEHRRWTRVVA
jgi:predicted metal-dependent HD superfamily phosphohydrolase